MLQKRILLLVSVATILFTSCDFTPSVINEPDCKVFAACSAQPKRVAQELYSYTMHEYEKSIFGENENERGDIVFEEGDDMWNLDVFTGNLIFYVGKWGVFNIDAKDLVDFLCTSKAPTEEKYPMMNEPLYIKELQYYMDGSEIKSRDKYTYFYSKDRAFKTVYEVCHGDLMPFKEELCKNIEVYDYRENEMSSTNRVTVYDVVYKVNGETYVWCSVSDMGDKTFEINLVNSSKMFSDLGF